MILTRASVAAIVLGVLLLGNTAFAASQNPAESLARLNTEAATQNVTLDDASKNKVQNSCQTTQNSLKSIRQKEQRVQRERADTYLDVQNEIDALQLRLKRQGVEVSQLGRVLMGYRELTDQYDRLSKPYSQALNDTITIECRENPEAFVAGLALTREKRSQLFDNTNAIQKYIMGDIQDQFNIIRIELKV